MVRPNDLTMGDKTSFIIRLEDQRTCNLLAQTEEFICVGLCLKFLLRDGVHANQALLLDMVPVVWLKECLRIELVTFIKYFHVLDLELDAVGD